MKDRQGEKTQENMLREIRNYERHLYEKERRENTVKKYIHDIQHFLAFVEKRMQTEEQKTGRRREIHREWIICYKEYLIQHYKVASVNSMLAALNGYLKYIGRGDCCVTLCRVQRQIFREEEKELSQEEYRRLVLQAEKNGNMRLGCILQTIGSTGIRVGELKYITVEALDKMVVCIRSKGKERCILLPRSLVVLLKEYCQQEGIRTGSIFITRTGKPIDRRNVWAEMKKLCKMAGVLEKKGYPHNLRHLFARTYYEKEKDIVRLADYLGHSNVETTRRYTRISSMQVCLEQLELGMLVKGFLNGDGRLGGNRNFSRENNRKNESERGIRKDIKTAVT